MKPASAQSLYDALVGSRDPGVLRALILTRTPPVPPDLIQRLAAYVRECLPRDSEHGDMLTDACLRLAGRQDRPVGWAHAGRARAHVHTTRRECLQAEPLYEEAARLFEDAGEHRELGRTRLAQAENLTYLGDYARAQALGTLARRLLEDHGTASDLAKVHIFSGNMLNRQNRYADALGEYDRARATLEGSENPLIAAAVELNRASVLVELNRFSEALAGLEGAREDCQRHGITLWADILDRNIARLYLSLGRYSDALRSLGQQRARYRESGDTRRLALCDQASAGVYLQLNMFDEAIDLAGHALETFRTCSSRFEAAEALGMIGIARAGRGEENARESFVEAIGMFREEGNHVSEAAMELQLGRIELGQENAAAAGVLAGRARETFEREGLPVRAAYARFVEAQALRAGGDSDAAFESARSALGGLDGYHAGWVSYQCRDLLASLHAGRGERGEAARLYREALGEIEALRGNLELDEFRMAFGRDKYQVYENLVALELEMGNTADAFGIVERSKSRTLIDMLERNTASAWRSGAGGKTGEEVRRLREELNGLYTRLSRPGAMAGRSVVNRALREEIGGREQALIEVLREAASEQAPWAVLEASPPPDVSGIQRMLARDEVLVEYYTIRERYCAFVIGKTEFAVFEALGTRAEVQEALKGLTFQMSKFMLAGAYLEDRRDQLLSSVRFHLRTLYDCLIAPLEGRLSGRSLVVVPHGVLHHVPFHALYDGSEHLIDRHDVVYGASAAVIRLCRERRRPPGTVRDLVLAVPDEAAPSLAEEAQVLGALLPQADVFVGEEATAAVLARYGGAAGRVHIAAHGVFRGDNPLFSSLRLGDTWLNLVDVFNLSLGSDLTTLSACETGLSSVIGGDELFGLSQGFLYAGTPSLVVSLWRVNDPTTTVFMRCFYEGLLRGEGKAAALRQAALDVKREHPHPYYWAPFILMGRS